MDEFLHQLPYLILYVLAVGLVLQWHNDYICKDIKRQIKERREYKDD